MKRHWIIFSSAALLLCAVTMVLRPGGRGTQLIFRPADGGLVGMTETNVHSRLGQPRLGFAGHYGLVSRQFADKFPGKIKTSVFRIPGGDEYVSFERRQDTWIVISNTWLQAGGVF